MNALLKPDLREKVAEGPSTPDRTQQIQELAMLIQSVSLLDQNALAKLYDQTVGSVYSFVLRIVGKAELAEEVAEDTYFQVWREAARFDLSKGSPMTWLFAMARSRAIDLLRREGRFQAEPLTELTSEFFDASDEAQPETVLQAQRDCEHLKRALATLSAQPRQLLALSFYRGLTHEEIALQMQLPLGTVKTQIRRALQTLQVSMTASSNALPRSH